MQLTHSPSTRIPSTPRASSYRRPLAVPPPISVDVSPYLPTVRSHGLLQASSLESPQPFHRPLSHHLTPSPRAISSSDPFLSSRISLHDSRLETFDSFGGNLHNPHPPQFFLSSPTDTSRVDPFDVIIPFTLGEHTYSPPLGLRRVSHWERQQQDRPRGFLQDEERERGEGGREGWPYILLSFFERFQAHRSSTTARPVLVTRRCDAPTRSLSPCSFFPE